MTCSISVSKQDVEAEQQDVDTEDQTAELWWWWPDVHKSKSKEIVTNPSSSVKYRMVPVSVLPFSKLNIFFLDTLIQKLFF